MRELVVPRFSGVASSPSARLYILFFLAPPKGPLVAPRRSVSPSDEREVGAGHLGRQRRPKVVTASSRSA
ncbi:hypothetical protein RJ55_03795 [Drechmeria coniospora]|nr:hypothetical protein RJ55_03795 [Drechmeria coniospora]